MPPGREWYLVALVLLLAGGAGAGFFFVPRVAWLETMLVRFVVPGTVELTFEQPGNYTIFHEPRSVVDGHYYVSKNIAGLRVGVVSAASGVPLELSMPGMKESYTLAGNAGYAVLVFNVPSSGRYRVSAGYDDGGSEPRLVLTVARGFIRGIFTTVLGTMAIGLSGLVPAVAITVVTYNRRRRARELLAAAPTAVSAGHDAARRTPNEEIGTSGFVKPEEAVTMNYARPGLRAVEGIIDLAISFVILWIVGLISGQTTEGGFNLSGAPALVGLVLVLVYFVVTEATTGATIGKLIVRLRVVNEVDGSPVGWSTAVVRNVLRIVDGLFFYLVGFIIVCVSKKRQRLGDKVAGTVVIGRSA